MLSYLSASSLHSSHRPSGSPVTALVPEAQGASAAWDLAGDEWAADDDIFCELDWKLAQERMDDPAADYDDGSGGEGVTVVDLLEEMVAGAELEGGAGACAQGVRPGAPYCHSTDQPHLSPNTQPSDPFAHRLMTNLPLLSVHAFAHRAYDDSPPTSREHSPLFSAHPLTSSHSSISLRQPGAGCPTPPRASLKLQPPLECPPASRDRSATPAPRRLGRARTHVDLRSEPRPLWATVAYLSLHAWRLPG